MIEVKKSEKQQHTDAECDRLAFREIVKRVDGLQENINLLKEFLTTLGIPLSAYTIWGYEGALEEDGSMEDNPQR